MNKFFFVFISLHLFEQIILISSGREVFYLPMKKNHKYGDDICYYREEIDEKRDYTIYYVKPCGKGQYCENEVGQQPFGFCRDILTNATDFPTYEEDCNLNSECLNELTCDNGKCKKICDVLDVNHPPFSFRNDLDSIECLPYGTKTNDDGKHCKMYEEKFKTEDPKYYDYSEVTFGKYPGIPKECGIIRFKKITDVERYLTDTSYKTFDRWIEESEDWCTIGEVEDGDFVTDWYFCKSGFTLQFYPNKDLVDPSHDDYHENKREMCVTPIQIDKNHPEVGTVVTYKIGDGKEQKYNFYKNYDDDDNLEDEVVIKSQLFREFSEEFKNASDEDKKNCYRIPQEIVGNCQNIKLLKLYYFYTHIKDYLFYKDRKDLDKVLHFKIQKEFPRYYEINNYLNLNYLFLLLILILL